MEEVERMSNKELKTLLEGTGIKNDFGEKRDIYLDLLRFAGAETCDRRDRRSTDYLMDKKIIMYINDHNPFFQTEWSDYCSADFCELNLTILQDLHKRFVPLKPKTRTEYVKVEFEHAWEAVKAWCEDEELFVKNPLVSSQEYLIAEFSSLRFPQKLYRAVEKEVDWRWEAHAHIREKSGYHWSTPISEVVNDESDIFLELARIALRATGELE